jgi:hypothetical protein
MSLDLIFMQIHPIIIISDFESHLFLQSWVQLGTIKFSIHPKLLLDLPLYLKSILASFCQVVSLLAIIIYFFMGKGKRVNYLGIAQK